MNEIEQRPGKFTLALTSVLLIPCLLLARIASQARINTTSVTGKSVCKRRHRFAGLLRIPGNLVLRFRRAPLVVLTRADWIERACRLVGGRVVDGSLELARIPGVPLSQFLAGEPGLTEKRTAVSAAMRALFDFHIRHDESHGDASADNVMIDKRPDGEFVATWFDFDVAHRDSRCMLVRRADDLRALLFTSQLWLTPVEFSSLIMEWNSHYPDENVLLQFQETMSHPLSHCDVFHLAQRMRVRKSVESQNQSATSTH